MGSGTDAERAKGGSDAPHGGGGSDAASTGAASARTRDRDDRAGGERGESRATPADAPDVTGPTAMLPIGDADLPAGGIGAVNDGRSDLAR